MATPYNNRKGYLSAPRDNTISDLRIFNVIDYGAKGDNSTDDTNAFQAALDAATGGGIVYIPKARNVGYVIAGEICIPSNVWLKGEHRDATLLKAAATYSGTTGAMISNQNNVSGGNQDITISDLTIRGTANVGYGILFRGVTFSTVRNINLVNFDDGDSVWGEGADEPQACIYLTQTPTGFISSSRNRFDSVFMEACSNGFVLTKNAGSSPATGSSFNDFYSCDIRQHHNIGYNIVKGEGNNFYGCEVTTSFDNTFGWKIADNLTGLFGCRADASFGGGSQPGTFNDWGFPHGLPNNSNTGILVDTGGDAQIFAPQGNGTTERINFTDSTAFALTSVIRQSYNRFKDVSVNSITKNPPNYVSDGANDFITTDDIQIPHGSTGGTKLGFYGTEPVVKPTVTGSTGSNAALISLLSALADLGLITDSTS